VVAATWRDKYPAMIATWESAWNDFVPFLDFPIELRQLVYTTNSIESLNSRFRKAVRHRGHFPTEQAALKVLYLVATERRKNRLGIDTERGTTRGEEPRRPTGTSDRRHQIGRAVDHVLTVVENEERRRGVQMPPIEVVRAIDRQAEYASNLSGQVSTVVEVGQLDHDHTFEVGFDLVSDLDGKPRLVDTAGTRQCHESLCRDQITHDENLASASDDLGARNRKHTPDSRTIDATEGRQPNRWHHRAMVADAETAVTQRRVGTEMLTNGTHNGTRLTSRRLRRHLSARGITHRRGGYRYPEPPAFIESSFGLFNPSRRRRPIVTVRLHRARGCIKTGASQTRRACSFELSERAAEAR
jgi:hypothetical protein